MLVGTTNLDTAGALAGKGKALENAVFAAYGFPRERTPKQEARHKLSAADRFNAAYKAAYGSLPVGSFPGLGYETIELLVGASTQAHSGLPSAIEQALSHGMTVSGHALAGRSYPAGGNHEPVGRLGIVKVVSGRLEPIYATEVSETG